MFKVAFIDDGISYPFSKRFNNIKTTYLEVTKACQVVNKKHKTFHYVLNHATICFLLYANALPHEFFEIISIKIIEKHEKTCDINKLITALKWCLENQVNVISLSIGSTYYRDFEQIDNLLKNLALKNIIIVAAFSNSNMITFPAASPYAIGVRSDSTNTLPSGGYMVLENGISNTEIIMAHDITNFTPKNISSDVMNGFNSFATPIIAAMTQKAILSGCSNKTEVINYLKKNISSSPIDLWQLRKKQINDSSIDIPVIVLIDEGEKSIELLKNLCTLFYNDNYSTYVLYDCMNEPIEQQAISLNKLLVNCNNDYYNALIFTQHYTKADLLIIFISTLKNIDLLINNKTIDIIISQLSINTNCKTIEYQDTSITSVTVLKERIISLLS